MATTPKYYPVLPRSKANPTGSDKLLAEVDKATDAKTEQAKADILALIERLPVYKTNAVLIEVSPEMLGQYYWAMDAQRLADLSMLIEQALERAYLDGGRQYLWVNEYINRGAELGAGQSFANLSALSPSYAASTTVEMVLSSPAYVQSMSIALAQSYEDWSGFTAATRRELSQIIAQGISQGLNPKTVAEHIESRFDDVIGWRARNMAQTELVGALRNARQLAATDAQTRLGLRIKLLWTSALKATTRANHAARHGKAYAIDDVQAFYATDGNRYNCRCAQTEVLVDENGKPILKQSSADKMSQERKDWES